MSRRRKLPRVLDEDEQDAIMDAYNVQYWTPHRDWTASLVMLDAGLRVSEVCVLTLDDIDLKRRKIRVQDGKGGKDRIGDLTPRLADALSDWLDRRAEKVSEDCDWLFPTGTENQLHPNQLRRAVDRAANRADLSEPDDVTPHTFRHTAAVDMLRHTGRLEIVRDFLGHESVQTTEIYARIVNGELEEAVSSFREEEEADDGPDVQAIADAIARLDSSARQQLARALE